MLQFIVHYGLHFIIFPGIVSLLSHYLFKLDWKKVYLIMLLTMLVDIDHLLANPIFDPERCSIGFHFLHSYWAIAVYSLMLFYKRMRIISIGLLLHMFTDYIDCIFM